LGKVSEALKDGEEMGVDESPDSSERGSIEAVDGDAGKNCGVRGVRGALSSIISGEICQMTCTVKMNMSKFTFIED
jgi:hypothetical protein